MIEELRHHGYHNSAGTLYPLLHWMNCQGYLNAKIFRVDGRSRRVYRATANGRRAIISTKVLILLGYGFWGFSLPKMARYGFWPMAHEARTDFCMVPGSLFLLVAGAGLWSLDARIATGRAS